MITDQAKAKVKAKFKSEGVTFKQWALDNDCKVSDVYKVMNGQIKAQWGGGHALAVKLGLKPQIAG